MPIQTPPNEPINNETPTTNTTLRTAVATRIAQALEMDGLEAAKRELNTMAAMFSFAPDWPSIYTEAASYLMEQKRQADQAEAAHKERIEKTWIDVMTKKAQSGQFNMFTGREAQAPYYSAQMGGDKQ